MELINQTEVQQMIDKLKDQDLYIHLEMTTGAYAPIMTARSIRG